MAGKNTLRAQAKLGDRTLRMTFGKWMAIEEETDIPCEQHLLDIETGLGARGMVKWVCWFIEGEITKEEAVELISEAGHKETMQVLGKITRSYLGLPEDGQENPPIAA